MVRGTRVILLFSLPGKHNVLLWPQVKIPLNYYQLIVTFFLGNDLGFRYEWDKIVITGWNIYFKHSCLSAWISVRFQLRLNIVSKYCVYSVTFCPSFSSSLWSISCLNPIWIPTLAFSKLMIVSVLLLAQSELLTNFYPAVTFTWLISDSSLAFPSLTSFLSEIVSNQHSVKAVNSPSYTGYISSHHASRRGIISFSQFFHPFSQSHLLYQCF